jgi:Zn-dependent protease
MGLISVLFQNPLAFVLLAVPLLYSLIIHEVAHAWVAEKVGDSTARWMGRISLDPRRHLDPIGTITLLLFGFGWAKPVPINDRNFRNYRVGLILVSAAGITANIIIACLAQTAYILLRPSYDSSLSLVLIQFIRINIILAAFNIIPIPPLDGSKILMGLSTKRFQYTLSRLEPYGMYIVLGLLVFNLLDRPIIFIAGLIQLFIRLILPF